MTYFRSMTKLSHLLEHLWIPHTPRLTILRSIRSTTAPRLSHHKGISPWKLPRPRSLADLLCRERWLTCKLYWSQQIKFSTSIAKSISLLSIQKGLSKKQVRRSVLKKVRKQARITLLLTGKQVLLLPMIRHKTRAVRSRILVHLRTQFSSTLNSLQIKLIQLPIVTLKVQTQ